MRLGLFLGIRILAFRWARLLAAFAGIGVAVVVMFIELGLLLGILDSQALVADLVRGELVVVSQARTNLHKWNEFDRIRLYQIGSLPGVDSVLPVYQGTMGLRVPESGEVRRIVVLSFVPGELPLAVGDQNNVAEGLETSRVVFFDRRSRPIFGDIRPGADVELDGQSYRVGGYVDIGPDIVNDGSVVMSVGSWLERHPASRPIMGVVRLQPGQDVQAMKQAIVRAIPDDVAIFTPAEIRAREVRFTLRSAPIGALFGIGMLAGLVIGAITCYQILFNEIVDRLDQYAMLKAMGFSDGFLKRIVLEQAFLLSCGGFVLGLAVAYFLYNYIADVTALVVRLSLVSAGTIFLLTAAMSGVAGLLAVRKAIRADPAELY